MLALGASLVAQTVKRLPTMRETRVGKIPWRRKWQPTPVFMLGKSHGMRSLGGYSPWGHKESDTTERLQLSSALVLRYQMHRREQSYRDLVLLRLIFLFEGKGTERK